ncbi:hypothetical protein C8R46DRAFT_1192534 [Mycena filopes]|nr:hypothetical protein C8R46DRAFT_1192534 [Mycena filopes]
MLWLLGLVPSVLICRRTSARCWAPVQPVAQHVSTGRVSLTDRSIFTLHVVPWFLESRNCRFRVPDCRSPRFKLRRGFQLQLWGQLTLASHLTPSGLRLCWFGLKPQNIEPMLAGSRTFILLTLVQQFTHTTVASMFKFNLASYPIPFIPIAVLSTLCLGESSSHLQGPKLCLLGSSRSTFIRSYNLHSDFEECCSALGLLTSRLNKLKFNIKSDSTTSNFTNPPPTSTSMEFVRCVLFSKSLRWFIQPSRRWTQLHSINCSSTRRRPPLTLFNPTQISMKSRVPASVPNSSSNSTHVKRAPTTNDDFLPPTPNPHPQHNTRQVQSLKFKVSHLHSTPIHGKTHPASPSPGSSKS